MTFDDPFDHNPDHGTLPCCFRFAFAANLIDSPACRAYHVKFYSTANATWQPAEQGDFARFFLLALFMDTQEKKDMKKQELDCFIPQPSVGIEDTTDGRRILITFHPSCEERVLAVTRKLTKAELSLSKLANGEMLVAFTDQGSCPFDLKSFSEDFWELFRAE